MSMKFKGEIVHTEKYTDKQTGEEKKKYTKAGALFEREDGSLCIKMFDTWFNIYPPKVNEQGYQKAKQAVQNDDFNDDISFQMNEKKYLQWIASLPCLVCTTPKRSQAAHLYADKNKTLARKSQYVVPLCCAGLDGLGCHEKHDRHLEVEYWDDKHEAALQAAIHLREFAGDTQAALHIIARF